MKDPEDLLRNAPRIQPRESLGRKMGRFSKKPGMLPKLDGSGSAFLLG